MNETNRGWASRLGAVAAVAAGVMASATASAAVCDFPFASSNECIEGSSIAAVQSFLDRPSRGVAQFTITLDMRGGSLAAVAWAIDVNGTILDDFSAADRNPARGEFEGIPFSDLFGRGDDHIVPSFSQFSWPFDLQTVHVQVF